MHPHDTPSGATPITPEERAALLAVLPSAGKERPAIHAHAAALYARLSMRKRDDNNGKKDVAEDDEPDSIKAQLYAGRRYASRIGVPVLHELDDTKSGLLSNREDYQRLIELAQQGTISHVIVFKADRLSRDDAEFVRVARLLLRLGIEIHDTLLGRLTADMIGLHAFISNQEVRATSARTTSAMAYRAQAGQRTGRPPLGYQRTLAKGVYEEDPIAGPAITELFRRYDDGDSLCAATRWLNAKLGMDKCPSAVGRLLRNPTYKGIYVWGKERKSKIDGRYARPRDEWVVARHNVPLVDEATWDRVQARLAIAANVGQHRERPARYLLAGLIWCATCGRRMCGHHQRDGYHLYVCPPCGMTRSQSRVDKAVRTRLEGVPIGAERISAALDVNATSGLGKAREQLAAVDARLAALTQRRVRLTALYADGALDAQDYAATLADTDKERADLRTKRHELEQTVHRASLAQASADRTAAWLRGLTSWTALLEPATHEERQGIYRECIARVVLDPDVDTLTIHWTPPIVRLIGRPGETIPLAARQRKGVKPPPRTPTATIALIQGMATAHPDWSAVRLREEIQARGVAVAKRTVQKYVRQIGHDARRTRGARNSTGK